MYSWPFLRIGIYRKGLGKSKDASFFKLSNDKPVTKNVLLPFLVFRRNAQPSPLEMFKGIGVLPQQAKLALYYKDTACTVSRNVCANIAIARIQNGSYVTVWPEAQEGSKDQDE